MMHHHLGIQVYRGIKLGSIGGTFEQQQPAAPTLLTAYRGLPGSGHGENIGTIQSRENARQSVAIGIRLNHAGNGTAGRQNPDSGQVMAHCRKINAGNSISAHGRILERGRLKILALC